MAKRKIDPEEKIMLKTLLEEQEKTQREIVEPKAIEELNKVQEGIRYLKLVRKIQEKFPDIKPKNIEYFIWGLHNSRPDIVYKPKRGLYRLIKFKEKEEIEEKAKTPLTKKEIIKEQDFYLSCAEFLVDLQECNNAIPLGGNRFKDKWGTPDVIGISRGRRYDTFKQPEEVISAEIKINSGGLITAFGQACAYKLFSHKVYLVVPKDSDKEQLESLCMICGIGLILFDKNNPVLPDWEIRVRAMKHNPDYYYINERMKLIDDKKELFD